MDPLFHEADPRIRIHIKMKWIRNTVPEKQGHPIASLPPVRPFSPQLSFPLDKIHLIFSTTDGKYKVPELHGHVNLVGLFCTHFLQHIQYTTID